MSLPAWKRNEVRKIRSTPEKLDDRGIGLVENDSQASKLLAGVSDPKGDKLIVDNLTARQKVESNVALREILGVFSYWEPLEAFADAVAKLEGLLGENTTLRNKIERLKQEIEARKAGQLVTKMTDEIGEEYDLRNAADVFRYAADYLDAGADDTETHAMACAFSEHVTKLRAEVKRSKQEEALLHREMTTWRDQASAFGQQIKELKEGKQNE